jgi:TolB-like protein/Flp pilus assembly protein TadD
VVVLPFVNLSPNETGDYFSDGLTEELINDLAKVPGIKVVARASSFQFKGTNEDLRAIGRKLGVANVLEGTVRREGNHLRVQADLTSTKDGFELWSDAYDRNIDDAFAVQEEIARAATRALRIKLLRAAGQDHSGNSRPSNAEAYQAYLQGKYFNGRGQGKEDLEQALAFTNQAIALDPKYAPAWAQRSVVLSTMGAVALMDNTDAHRSAQHDAERAIALDPELADGYVALAAQQMSDDRDWEGAAESLKKAEQLEPGSVQVLGQRAQLLRIVGRVDESIDLAKRAAAIDPVRARIVIFLGNLLYYAGRYEEADAALRKALELNPQASAVHAIRGKMFISQGRLQEALAEMELEPSDWYKYAGLALVYQALGRTNDSQSALEQLIAAHKSECAYQIAEVYAYRGDNDNAFEWLDRAYDQRDSGIRDLKIDPLFKSLHKDQRYHQLLKKMRLENGDYLAIP